MKKPVLPGNTYVFNGVNLRTGDIVAFIAKSLPHEMQAAFTHVDEEGNLNVFSTLLVPFKRGGCFSSNDVEQIMIIRSGEDAILCESKNKDLLYGQEAITLSPMREIFEGVVIAAFDGIVSLWSKEYNDFVTGGSAYFRPV